MSRLRTWQIWTVAAFFAALLVLAGVVGATTDPALHVTRLGLSDFEWGLNYLAFLLLGALICSRRPENVVGPLFMAGGVVNALVWASGQYAVWALARHPGSLPGGAAVMWFGDLLWCPALALLVLAVSVFPTGHLPSRRWRWLPWTLAAAVTIIDVLVGVALWPIRGIRLVRTDIDPTSGTTASWVIPTVYPVVLVCALAAMLSIFVRYRRAHDIERLQLKWLMVAALVAAPALIVGELSPMSSNHVVSAVTNVLDNPVWIAVAATLAILRYRLYDIDRVISRTVSYLIVTGLLAGVYVGVIAVSTAVLGGSSSVRVAAATLAAAAAFQPVRRAVQSAVDRRFNRARYDAARTVDGFSARLRDAVDADAVAVDLVAVVGRTIAPASASLWLRSAP